MKNIINKWYKNHALIYKIFLFIGTTFLIVYLFPKSGKFKYNFDKNKPWQSENLYAPFDFAIQKSSEELQEEKSAIVKESAVYFDRLEEVKNFVFEDYNNKFNATFPDSLGRIKTVLHKVGRTVLNQIYKNGVLEEDYNYPNDKNVILL